MSTVVNMGLNLKVRDVSDQRLSFLGAQTPRYDLFGWRQGILAARGFYVLPVGTAVAERRSDIPQTLGIIIS